MKIAFLSNYMNHHQLGLCDKLCELVGADNFYFVQEEALTKEKMVLGYGDDFYKTRKYILLLNKSNTDLVKQVILESDIIINSFSQGLNLLDEAMKKKKVIFWYSERLYKDYSFIKTIAKYLRALMFFKKYENENQYQLLASFYGYDDIMKTAPKLFSNHCFLFGYFPVSNSSKVLKKAICSSKFSFLFVGRLIKWKHPETVFEVAQFMERVGIEYSIDIVGSGPLEKKLALKIEKQYKDRIHMLGPTRFDKMKSLYLQHDFFIFPSDRREGWGATLNEAMSYGCIPLANKSAGSAMVLIKDGINGYLYKKRIEEALVKMVADSSLKKLSEFSETASKTIVEGWNYNLAGNRLYQIFSNVLNKKDCCLYASGTLMSQYNTKKGKK